MRLQKNIEKVTQVVMFENWLRFYFIVEEGDKLLMRLPEKAMEQIRTRYSSYYDLAEILNNAEIDHQTSLKAVCLHASSGGDGAPLNEKDLSEVFDSPDFQLELQLFSSWVQGHEEQLDERFLEFSEWLQAYTAWKNSDEVRELAHKIAQSLAFDRTDGGTLQ
ncbi:hypothetical protein LJC46_05520 [Desulfovibrio sp. OttesenSCG-928-G15]|nr:hypothetical protein [Desulfovibrio sp. OttesenSCG-928-G15]